MWKNIEDVRNILTRQVYNDEIHNHNSITILLQFT